MESELDRRRPDTFVIQVTANVTGELTGLIHHVRTGERRRFEGLQGLTAAVRGMVRRDVSDSGPEHS